MDTVKGSSQKYKEGNLVKIVVDPLQSNPSDRVIALSDEKLKLNNYPPENNVLYWVWIESETYAIVLKPNIPKETFKILKKNLKLLLVLSTKGLVWVSPENILPV